MKRRGASVREPAFTWNDIREYPGVFEPGSEADAWIEKARQQEAEQGTPLRFSGRLTQLGLVDDALLRPATMHVPHSGSAKLGELCDRQTLVEIDRRVRFCRCLLGNTIIRGIASQYA